jgi:hypothetical protein
MERKRKKPSLLKEVLLRLEEKQMVRAMRLRQVLGRQMQKHQLQLQQKRNDSFTQLISNMNVKIIDNYGYTFLNSMQH